ncbi:hypothetical protein [Geminicoccus flavidas]|uniref:hypothetical protein n=1 Tax=Geminicoccus flavidas TaxID=2506407 RepID=UPI00135C0DB0|nr:hypothetical protein [Geminicoccus flavidas]
MMLQFVRMRAEGRQKLPFVQIRTEILRQVLCLVNQASLAKVRPSACLISRVAAGNHETFLAIFGGA